jgi:hypothetical protein
VDRLVERLRANKLERIELLATVLREELKRQQEGLADVRKALPDPEGNTMVWLQLVEDGFKKAETIRSAERVRRIGAILMNALMVLPQVNPDEVEELMRVAVDLSDTDVVVLREFVRIEGAGVTNPRGRMDRYDAHSRWEFGEWRSLGISEGDLQSTCSKLEGFGLVTRIAPPNNLNILADFETRYALLQKGQRFVEFVKSSTAKSSDTH